MRQIARFLKKEIIRLARKEARVGVLAVKKECASLKAQLRELSAMLAAMEKSRMPARGVDSRAVASDPVAPKSAVRFNSQALKSLRRRLGVSQRQMGQLVGVSAQAVYLWEAKGGSLRLRKDTRRALLKLKASSRRDVAQLLAAPAST